MRTDSNGAIFSPKTPIIQRLNKRPEIDPRLKMCEEVFSQRITYDELAAETKGLSPDELKDTRFYNVLCITGRPWRFCDYWGVPDTLRKTGTKHCHMLGSKRY